MINAKKERIERLLIEPGKTSAMKLVEIWLILNHNVEAETGECGGRDAAIDKLKMLTGVSRSTIMKTMFLLRRQERIVGLERGYRYVPD